jgi:GntR family transcriptional regulator
MHSDEVLLISQADRRPMYLQIMEQIRHRIAVGDWLPGRELPSIRVLAAAVQVSVITVKRAYLELERDGVIATRQGRGSFVADSADLSTQLRREEVDEHLSAAAEIAQELGLTSDELVLRLREAVRKRDETREKE